MAPEAARRWIILSSLGFTAAFFVFFTLGPVLGYPLSYAQATRLLEIVLPVFLGYLGSATKYLFGRKRHRADGPPDQLLGYVVRGALFVFALCLVATLFAFAWGNRAAAAAGEGMSVDTLAWLLSGLLGLMAVTTGIVAENLFGRAGGAHAPASESQLEPVPLTGAE